MAADPSKADALTTIGDSAVSQLRIIYTLEQAGIIPDAHKATLIQVRDDLRQTLRNAEGVKTRERDTRVQRPLTKVPAEDYGDRDDITNIRTQNLPQFDGESKDPAEVSRWLSKVLVIAQGYKLKLPVVVSLLAQASTGKACDYIEQLRDEGKSLREVIELLEMTYGCLVPKEEARVKCSSMKREDGESLSSFLHRLRHMARIACRYEDDNTTRCEAIDELVEANVRRILPPSVKTALEERILARRRIGLTDFTSREIERECLELEKAREDKRKEIALQLSSNDNARKGKFANIAAHFSALSTTHVDVDSDVDVDVVDLIRENHLRDSKLSPPASSDEDQEQERDIYLAGQIARERMKFQRAGKPVDQRRVMKGAVRKYNNRYIPKDSRSRVVGEINQPGPPLAQRGLVHNQTYYQNQRQPPNHNPDLRNRSIMELLDLSKCQRGQCIQCGLRGHLLGRDECPLKDKPLVDSPCVACHQGLHASNDCVRIFQQDFQPPQVQGAQQVQELHLN